MRVIAGNAKGMKLLAPEGDKVRPSSDLLRGALMSQLGAYFDGESMLDVCAGTGAMAIEFLSRGCGHAVAIEVDPVAVAVLEHNARHTRLRDAMEVLVGPAEQHLQKLAGQQRQFDYIFLDPPWQAGLYQPLLDLIVRGQLLAPAGQLIVESPKGLPVALWEGRLVQLSSRRYGSAYLERFETPLATAGMEPKS
jgi:16S rRNA (guanine966-N2)-methyltransferase